MGDVEMTVESPENKDQARGGEESGGGVAGQGRHCLARSKTVPDQSTWSGEWTRQIMRQRLGNRFMKSSELLFISLYFCGCTPFKLSI